MSVFTQPKAGHGKTATEPGPSAPEGTWKTKGSLAVNWITTTDHKKIGYMYLIAGVIYFMVGGLLALIIRAQLFSPGLELVATKEQFNQLFTMHGTIMLLMFSLPIVAGFANVLIPLQIGAPGMAFPRLNAFGFWAFLFGSFITISGYLTPQGPPGFGWTAYTPLSQTTFSPGVGGHLWSLGIVLIEIGSICYAVNLITTILTMRAPGMTMFRMPILTWNLLLSGIMLLIADPPLAAAVAGLGADRIFGAHVFDASVGGALLWQHMFWFFGHTEVYVIALPFFGIISEIVPVFSRKPMFGFKGLVLATIGISSLTVTLWAHHMFTTGGVLLPFFAFMSMLIAVPTGVKMFNWIGTMWRGSLTFETPMLWVIGFLIVFSFGGLTGILISSPPLDFHVHDTYFIVAHFHYTVFGAVVFTTFGGLYFWWPKFTGRMLNDTLGKWHFWLLFIGFNITFLVQHWLGVMGMPRRYYTYLPSDGYEWMNQLSTVGSAVLAISMIPFLLNVYLTQRKPRPGLANDPWGYARSLEWATSCPPPRFNFTSIPRIRSESPAFDLHHPEAAGLEPAQVGGAEEDALLEEAIAKTESD